MSAPVSWISTVSALTAFSMLALESIENVKACVPLPPAPRLVMLIPVPALTFHPSRTVVVAPSGVGAPCCVL